MKDSTVRSTIYHRNRVSDGSRVSVNTADANGEGQPLGIIGMGKGCRSITKEFPISATVYHKNDAIFIHKIKVYKREKTLTKS